MQPEGTYSYKGENVDIRGCRPQPDNGQIIMPQQDGFNCNPGYYKSGDKKACLACPAGTYRATSGAVSVTECVSCEGNTYSEGGAAQCTNAPLGGQSTPDKTSFTCDPTDRLYKAGTICKTW